MKRLRATVSLSADLLYAVDVLVKAGETESRNGFLEEALRVQLTACRQAAIDAEFSQMATDRAYQCEAMQVVEDFVEADWEALDRLDRAVLIALDLPDREVL